MMSTATLPHSYHEQTYSLTSGAAAPTPLNYCIKTEPISTPGSTSTYEPLDLSCKGNDHDDKAAKRREQNKAAALSYRRRKKSQSDLIDTAYEESLKKNQGLVEYRNHLENQIAHMRSLLKALPPPPPMVVSQPPPLVPLTEETSLRAAGSDAGYASDTHSEETSSHQSLVSGGSCDFKTVLPYAAASKAMDRRASWPLDAKGKAMGRRASWPLDAKERKKEQNRLASKRFRERRKLQKSENELEMQILLARREQLLNTFVDLRQKVQLLRTVIRQRTGQIHLPFNFECDDQTGEIQPPPLPPPAFTGYRDENRKTGQQTLTEIEQVG